MPAVQAAGGSPVHKRRRMPPALIEKSYATPSLMAGILKRSDILITRASMAAWAIGSEVVFFSTPLS